MDEILRNLGIAMEGEKNVFRSMSDGDLKQLSVFFQSKNIPVGDTLWKEKDPFDYIAFIVSGKVEIKKKVEFGDMNVIIGVYSTGALCILDDSLKKVTAEAIEDVTLAVITQENLDRLIETNPHLGAKLLKGMLLTVSDRLKKSFDRLTVFF